MDDELFHAIQDVVGSDKSADVAGLVQTLRKYIDERIAVHQRELDDADYERRMGDDM